MKEHQAQAKLDVSNVIGLIILLIVGIVSVIGTLIHLNHPPYKEQAEFAQKSSFSELLSLQSDLADKGIHITYRFMIMDTTVIPEAIVLVQGLNSTQLDIVTQKQAEYQKVLFGLRLRL
jgi:hypothetical protein